MAKARIRIDFEETLEGDEKGSSSFYWKITPKIQFEIEKISDKEIKRAVLEGFKRFGDKGVFIK